MKIISIIIKDLKVMFSDKKALAIMILMPMILTTILSIALKGSFSSGSDSDFEPVNIAIIKQYDAQEDSEMFKSSLNSNFLLKEMGEATLKDLMESGDDINPEKIFFEDFMDSDDVSEFIHYKVEEETKAMEQLNNEEVSAIVILPEKFIYNMKINLLTPFRNNVEIKVLTHPDKNISGKIVTTIMDAYTNTMSSVIIGKNVIIEAALTNNLGNDGFSNMEEIMEGMTDLMESININIDDVVLEGRKPIKSSDYYAVAMMTMFILFAAGQGGRMLLEEKDNLTYQRMTVGGVSKFQILSGKFITVFIIALFQITVMITFSSLALKVQWGDLKSVALISIAAAFAIAGLGSFVGALTYSAGNYKMANAFENVIIQGMALLGGSFFPLDVMPEFMQKLSFLSLNGVALKSYLKIIKGYHTPDVLNNIFILALAGAVFTILAVMILKGKEGESHVKHNKIKTIKA
ncbi:MAG: ABC transporter permease [Sedimentibacter sp.]